jgi:hypothetical protein
VDAASSYTTIGTMPAVDQIASIRYVNTTDVDVRVSYDSGTSDHTLIPAGTSYQVNFDMINMFLDDGETPQFKKDSGTASTGVFEIEFMHA